jgi:hypothetical protein
LSITPGVADRWLFHNTNSYAAVLAGAALDAEALANARIEEHAR